MRVSAKFFCHALFNGRISFITSPGQASRLGGFGGFERTPLSTEKVRFLRRRSASLVYDPYDRSSSLVTMYLATIFRVRCLRSIARNSVKNCLAPWERAWLYEEYFILSNRHALIDCIECIALIKVRPKTACICTKTLNNCFLMYIGVHSMLLNYNCIAGHENTVVTYCSKRNNKYFSQYKYTVY